MSSSIDCYTCLSPWEIFFEVDVVPGGLVCTGTKIGSRGGMVKIDVVALHIKNH